MGSIHMRLIEGFDINNNVIIVKEFQRGDESINMTVQRMNLETKNRK
jgi:hypothetical protein